MKKIEAIIKPFKLEEVKEDLNAIGIKGMTVNEMRGFGSQRGHKETYRGAEYRVDFVSKIEIDVVVEATMVEQIVTTIQGKVKKGEIGDGKIFVLPVKASVRIRTGESGRDAV